MINLGSAGFAATVLWFYFSSVMDKLGRSFSLIALGLLFLAGRVAAGEGSAAAGGPHFAGGDGMRLTKRAVLLIVIQVLLVSTIAGKFLYERKVCPRVWTRAAQVDPDSPLRGRYLILPLRVDACGLPKEGNENQGGRRFVRRELVNTDTAMWWLGTGS